MSGMASFPDEIGAHIESDPVTGIVMNVEEFSVSTSSSSNKDIDKLDGNSATSAISWKLDPIPSWVLWVATVLLLASGTYDSIAFKWMNLQYLPSCDGCPPKYFEGPFYQTLVMYIGELLCMFVYWIDYYFSVTRKGKRYGIFDMPTSAESFRKVDCPVWWWLVPTCLDYTSSSMINYATIFTLASTVQILGSFSVLLTAILSLAYLRVALRVHHYVGIAIVTCGIILTAVYSLTIPGEDTNYDSDMSYVGIILSLAGYALSSFQFVFEEKLFRKYYCSPMYGVGCEGVFGTIIGVVILVICQYAGWEDVKGCMYQTIHSSVIITADITSFFSVMVFNASGLMVTKIGSGLLRAILFSIRSCLVWLVEMCIGWNDFDWLDFFGLVLVIIGALVYNNIVPYMCCPGFKKVMTKQLPFWCVKAVPEDDELNELPLFDPTDRHIDADNIVLEQTSVIHPTRDLSSASILTAGTLVKGGKDENLIAAIDRAL